MLKTVKNKFNKYKEPTKRFFRTNQGVFTACGMALSLMGQTGYGGAIYGLSQFDTIINSADELFNGVQEKYKDIWDKSYAIDSFTTRSDQRLMFAFLKYVYLDNETPRAQYYLQKSENINITSLDINIVGESGKISFPEDGYIEWTEIETVGSENGSPVVKKRNFYCKISNYQHGFINLSINIKATQEDMDFYQILKKEFLKNYDEVFSSNDNLNGRYINERDDWVYQALKRPTIIPKTVNLEAQIQTIDFIEKNKSHVQSGDLRFFMLKGASYTGKSELCTQISNNLLLPLFKIVEFDEFALKDCWRKLPSGCIIDISDLAWAFYGTDLKTGELFQKPNPTISELGVRFLIENAPINSIIIVSCNPEYYPIYTTVLRGFIHRMHVIVNFDTKVNGENYFEKVPEFDE